MSAKLSRRQRANQPPKSIAHSADLRKQVAELLRAGDIEGRSFKFEPIEPDENTPRLHFRGDCTEIDPSAVSGPDRFGAHYRATFAEYDAESDRTTIYYLPISTRSPASEHPVS